MNKKYFSAAGVFVGTINALLGAGGGMLVVPLLRKYGLNQTQAHATSIAVIIPLTIFSAAMYMISGYVSIKDVLVYLPFGIAGSLFGAWLLPRIPQKWLRKIFSLFIIWAAVRMLMK